MSSKDIFLNDSVSKERGVKISTKASIVSTNPCNEAYVMVLKNNIDSCGEAVTMKSVKRFCDITFLVGEERRPVNGIRTIMSMRSGPLQQLFESKEKNPGSSKESVGSKFIRTLSGIVGQKSQSLTIPMEQFDPEAFEEFIKYIHCGVLTAKASNVIGLINAAHIFEFPELIKPCWDYGMGCAVRSDNLQDLLESAKKYKDNKITKAFLKEMRQRESQYPEIKRFRNDFDELTQEDCLKESRGKRPARTKAEINDAFMLKKLEVPRSCLEFCDGVGCVLGDKHIKNHQVHKRAEESTRKVYGKDDVVNYF